MAFERTHAGYRISDDPALLDLGAIHLFLSEQSYWAAGQRYEVVARAVAHSLCLGVYAADGSQVGFCKIITDRAVTAHLNDVFILPEHRGKGLGGALVRMALEHPDLASVGSWWLGTRDAHGLYAKFGFVPVADATNMMQRRLPPISAASPVDATRQGE